MSNLLAQVGNLAAPVEEWTVGGTALTALMDVERRHGMNITGSVKFAKNHSKSRY